MCFNPIANLFFIYFAVVIVGIALFLVFYKPGNKNTNTPTQGTQNQPQDQTKTVEQLLKGGEEQEPKEEEQVFTVMNDFEFESLLLESIIKYKFKFKNSNKN